MQLGETDWGSVLGDVFKSAAGAYTVSQQTKAQTDLLKTQMKMQVPTYGLPGTGGYSPQYSPVYSSGGSGVNFTLVALIGAGLLGAYLLLGSKK